jgi:hypothetical protein
MTHPLKRLCRALSPVVVAGLVGCATAPEAWDSRSSRAADDAVSPPNDTYRSQGVDVADVASAPSPVAMMSDAVGGFFASKSAESREPPPPPPPKAPPLATQDGKPESTQKPLEAAKRLVIYTGSMSLMVPTVDTALDGFLVRVTGLGGYLQSRSASTVTVRVPAAEFFAVLDGLRKVGTVTDEQVNAQDVTKRVFDIELRLQTADESRKRLMEILKSATKIEDILRIETEIRRLTDEIEAMKGELRNLGDQIAFSTLTVAFYANAPAPRPYPDRTRSRFEWINSIGVEQVLYGF